MIYPPVPPGAEHEGSPTPRAAGGGRHRPGHQHAEDHATRDPKITDQRTVFTLRLRPSEELRATTYRVGKSRRLFTDLRIYLEAHDGYFPTRHGVSVPATQFEGLREAVRLLDQALVQAQCGPPPPAEKPEP